MSAATRGDVVWAEIKALSRRVLAGLLPQVRTERVGLGREQGPGMGRRLGRRRAVWTGCGRRQPREGCAGARGGRDDRDAVCCWARAAVSGSGAAAGGCEGKGDVRSGEFGATRADVESEEKIGETGSQAGVDKHGGFHP